MIRFCREKSCVVYVCLMLGLLGISVLWALSIGTVHFSISKIWETVISEAGNPVPLEAPGQGSEHDIIWLLRMPRIVLAACVGAGLALSGAVMQAIVKNPLADPYILGVSSGASLGATASILLGIGMVFGENFVGVCAFLGAFAVSLGVVFIANMGGRATSIKLLLAGMALSAVCSAFSSFIIYFANNREGMQTVAFWMMGSLAGAKWSIIEVMLPLIILASGFFCMQSRILNLMLLGDESAVTLGTDLHRYRQVYLLVSSLIVGFAVYAAGMIGFVGLMVPHVIRMTVGSDHRKLIPLSALAGAIFLVVSDGLCRIIIPHAEIPIGILVSLIGAPCFVYLMIKKTYRFGGDEE